MPRLVSGYILLLCCRQMYEWWEGLPQMTGEKCNDAFMWDWPRNDRPKIERRTSFILRLATARSSAGIFGRYEFHGP
jgi:hypothetical protein